MSNTAQLFIPEKVRVGQVERNDTYSKRLAYVIYYDQKGVLRKESSWQSWRDKNIEPLDFDNVPTEGFVLNKGVGGQRQSYGWNARNEYIRVYDPRDFEFEISVANLLFILRECDCSKGKGLEGKFVYAWGGTELVLLPVISEDYQNSQVFTSLKEKSVHVKNLILGATYLTKKQDILTYLGRFDYFFCVREGQGWSDRAADQKGVHKKFVFWDGKRFLYLNDIKTLAQLQSETVAANYADLVSQYNNSPHGSRAVRLFLKEKPKRKEDNYWPNSWYVPLGENAFQRYSTSYKTWPQEERGKIEHIASGEIISLSKGVLREQHCDNKYAYPPDTPVPAYRRYYGVSSFGSSHRMMEWREPTNTELWVELESGVEMKFSTTPFYK